jgi:hypothetical protein
MVLQCQLAVGPAGDITAMPVFQKFLVEDKALTFTSAKVPLCANVKN